MRVPEKNWLEWTVFVLGIICIASVVMLLGLDALRSSAEKADLVVRLGAAEERDGRRYIPVTVVNSGGDAASGVRVEVLLERDSGVIERAQLVVDLVPRKATRVGWVAFAGARAPSDRVRVGGVAFEAP